MRTIRWSSYLVLTMATAFVTTTTPAFAVGFGFKGGLSVATLHGGLPTDGLVENGFKAGFAGGGWISIPLGGVFSLQPEVLYAAKGTSLGSLDVTDPFGISLGNVDVAQSTGYLEIPVLARLSFPTGGAISPFVVGGPVVGFRLTQKLDISGLISTSFDTDVFRSTDLGFALGAGMEMGRGGVRGTFEARYTMGVTTATEDFFSDSARNGDLLVLAGLAFRR